LYRRLSDCLYFVMTFHDLFAHEKSDESRFDLKLWISVYIVAFYSMIIQLNWMELKNMWNMRIKSFEKMLQTSPSLISSCQVNYWFAVLSNENWVDHSHVSQIYRDGKHINCWYSIWWKKAETKRVLKDSPFIPSDFCL
jgi:hypothetical protein